MKYFFFSFLAIGLFLTSGCDTERFEGSGNIITDDRTAGAFSAIEVSDALTLTVRQGDDRSVVVRGDDNLLPRLRTTISGGILDVDLLSGSYRNATLSVEITAPELARLELNDACRGELIDFVSTVSQTFELDDASTLDMTGSAPSVRMEISDASEVNAFGFTADRCRADVSDASNVRLTVSERLEGSVSDASTFRFRGSPTVDVNTSDASRVIDAN